MFSEVCAWRATLVRYLAMRCSGALFAGALLWCYDIIIAKGSKSDHKIERKVAIVVVMAVVAMPCW